MCTNTFFLPVHSGAQNMQLLNIRNVWFSVFRATFTPPVNGGLFYVHSHSASKWHEMRECVLDRRKIASFLMRLNQLEGNASAKSNVKINKLLANSFTVLNKIYRTRRRIIATKSDCLLKSAGNAITTKNAATRKQQQQWLQSVTKPTNVSEHRYGNPYSHCNWAAPHSYHHRYIIIVKSYRFPWDTRTHTHTLAHWQ